MHTAITRSVLLLGIAALACQQAPQPVDLDAARASLRSADSAYSHTTTTKDLEGFVAMYEADAAMYPPGEATAQGSDAIRNVASGFLQDTAFAATFTPVVVEVGPSGDIGYTLNSGSLRFTGPDGKPVTERLRDFHVWRRQADGSWKVVVDFVADVPGQSARGISTRAALPSKLGRKSSRRSVMERAVMAGTPAYRSRSKAPMATTPNGGTRSRSRARPLTSHGERGRRFFRPLRQHDLRHRPGRGWGLTPNP